MLPLEIEQIIEEYSTQIDQLESLPEISAIKRLVTRSNHHLISTATQLLSIPMSIMMEIVCREEFNEPYLLYIQNTARLITDFNTCLIFSFNNDFATSSLFWVYIIRDPNLYFGAYTSLFEESLLFKLVNFVTQG